jgi:DNA-directed RNA polymerase subunit RPC12/RpoP
LASLKKNETNTNENCTCPNDECGKSFDHPIQLTVLSNDPVETYPACPYCMSRIDLEEENMKHTDQLPKVMKIKAVLQEEKEREESKDTNEPKCQHGFGYLKKRSKGSPIPDECLICQKMIQCLS